MSRLLVEYFAGGGGASEALKQAYGKEVDIAINHDPIALAMHAANHPSAMHVQEDVFKADLRRIIAQHFNELPIVAGWFSPDCTHFSGAKGGKPVDNARRGLAWVVLRVASMPLWQRPEVIHLENVKEFETWGPLDKKTMRPIPELKGTTFKLWVGHLQALGYKVDWWTDRACDFGAGTIRNRLYLTARRDGLPIVRPKHTHYDPKKPPPAKIRRTMQPYRAAAEFIDWSIPCPSIFLTKEEGKAIGVKRPLAENTLKRIAAGIMRYVVNNPNPFIVPITHSGDSRFHPIDEPIRTITTANGGEFALVSPHVTKFHQGQVGSGADEPLPTITANSYVDRPGGAPPLGVVAASLIQTGYGEREGQAPRTKDIDAPLGTFMAGGGKHALIAAHLNVMRNAQKPISGADEPVHTITAGGAHMNLVTAMLSQFSGTTEGKINDGHELTDPVSTIVGRGPLQALTTAHLLSLKGTERRDQSIDEPAPSFTAGGTHAAVVSAFLLSYYGASEVPVSLNDPMHTVTTRDRFGLVTVTIAGLPYVIVDIGMRMLTPRELFNAQGFPPDYKIDIVHNGRRISKSDQIEKVGNSVSPPPAIALAVANAPPMSRLQMPEEIGKRRRQRA